MLFRFVMVGNHRKLKITLNAHMQQPIIGLVDYDTCAVLGIYPIVSFLEPNRENVL